MNGRAAIHQWISAAGKSDEGLRAGDTRMKNDTAGLQRESERREICGGGPSDSGDIEFAWAARIPMIYVPRFI
jgi:hypothetical protein